MAEEQKVDQLTDAEMAEALGPLDKQLRSLVQIREGITAYFQAKEEIQGLIARRDGLVDAVQRCQEEYDRAKIELVEQLRADREEAKLTREADIRGRKEALNEVEEEIRQATTAFNAKRADLARLSSTHNRRMGEQDKAFADKQAEHAKEMAAMETERLTTAAELERVKGVLSLFLKEHGLAPVVAIEEPVAADA